MTNFNSRKTFDDYFRPKFPNCDMDSFDNNRYFSKSLPCSENERNFFRGYNAEELLEAAQNGDAGRVGLRLRYGANSETRTPVSRKTPLILAAENGHLIVVALLLKHGADVNAQDFRGWTPLAKAADGGYANICSYLVEHAPSALNINEQLDSDGETALMLAVKRGHGEVVKTLLELGADATVENWDGQTALGLANDGEIKKLLALHSKRETLLDTFCFIDEENKV